jgi:hypothetical protein
MLDGLVDFMFNIGGQRLIFGRGNLDVRDGAFINLSKTLVVVGDEGIDLLVGDD